MTAGPIARKRSSRNGPAGCWAFPHTIARARQRTVAAAILIGNPRLEGRRHDGLQPQAPRTRLRPRRGGHGLRTLVRARTPSLRRVDEHTILLPHDAVLHDIDDMRQ